MKSIYIVFADFGYEGEVALKGFASSFSAHEFVKKLYHHTEKKPCCPESIGDTQENNTAWEKYINKDAIWQKKHPGGDAASSADSFIIRNIPFVE